MISAERQPLSIVGNTRVAQMTLKVRYWLWFRVLRESYSVQIADARRVRRKVQPTAIRGELWSRRPRTGIGQLLTISVWHVERLNALINTGAGHSHHALSIRTPRQRGNARACRENAGLPAG